jgi:heme-degrading monooxygenase HmoA
MALGRSIVNSVNKSVAEDSSGDDGAVQESPPRGPFVVIYRWRLHRGREQSFVDAWTRITTLLHEQCGSLGARLHRGADGVWSSYAQWPSARARADAFARGPVDPVASQAMRDAIAEGFPETILETVVDRLAIPKTP